MNTTEYDLTNVADALASAIAILAAVSQPGSVAVEFRKHINALAAANTDSSLKGVVLNLIGERLDALIE